MRRILLAAALSLSPLVVPVAAHAAAHDLILGGCGWEFEPSTSGATTWEGVIHDASATTDATGLPTAATVTCWAIVNGTEAPGTRFSYSGFGVQSGVDRVSFTAAEGDWVDLCEQVTFADGTTQLHGGCGDPNFYLPPQAVIDVLDIVFNDLDPLDCPALARLAGTYGPVTIAPDGDVYVADPLDLGLNPIYDCPPYGNF